MEGNNLNLKIMAKKTAPQKTGSKKEISHTKKIQTGQPEIKTEPEEPTDFEPDKNEEIQQDTEQPQEEIDEPSIAEILKRNKVN